MKKMCLFLLGFIPFGLGFIMNLLIMQLPNTILPFRVIGICFLFFWGFLGFTTYKYKESFFISIFLVNLPAFSVLLLNLYQEIVLGRYWGNWLSNSAQFYYLPTLNISFSLTFWSSRVWVAYIASFLLMYTAYYTGFQFRSKRTK